MSAALAIAPRLDQRPSAKAAAFFRLRPDLARAFARRGEIGRLVAFRKRHDVEIGDLSRWSIVIAELAAQKTELDIDSFSAVAKGAGLEIDVETAMRAIYVVAERRQRQGAGWKQLNGDRVAAMLDVTAEERWQCEIRTIGAVDETPAQRVTRLSDERRERDRLRKRRQRAKAKKIKAERVVAEAEIAASQKPSTRIIYNSAGGPADETAHPWVEMGISRATWYRRRKAGLEAIETRDAIAEPSLAEPSLPENSVIGGRQPASPCLQGRPLPLHGVVAGSERAHRERGAEASKMRRSPAVVIFPARFASKGAHRSLGLPSRVPSTRISGASSPGVASPRHPGGKP